LTSITKSKVCNMFDKAIKTLEFHKIKEMLCEIAPTEGARKLAALVASKLPGSGGIYLVDAMQSGAETEVVFARHVRGIPVDMKDTAYFIRVVIKGNIVSAARVNVRCFDTAGSNSDVLSEQLAAAAFRGSGLSGELSLCYDDEGEASVSPVWLVGGIEKNAEEAE